jgi:hypothetical protein
MARAWDAVTTYAVIARDVDWRVRPVRLPLRDGLSEEELLKTLDNRDAGLRERIRAARDLVWTRRCKAEETIDVSCLRIGEAYVLHMPGELFVEYQLAAQKMRPGHLVCMAAYGDYGPGYIGTAIAYEQGGYETSGVSRVGPQVEAVLMAAMRELLE